MKEYRKFRKRNQAEKKEKRHLALAFLICAAMLFTGGCTSENVPEETEDDTAKLTVVGFSEVGAESDWRVANTESMKATFTEANGYELLFDDAKQKQENQIAAIRNFILQEVDYIVVSPVVVDGWEGVLQEAKDADIPVIVVVRMVKADADLFAAWVGSAFSEEGQKATAWLENSLKEQARVHESFDILHLPGT